MSATPKKQTKKRKKKRKGSALSSSKGAATPSPFPRLGWSRSPVGGPQSSKKGKHGYDRKRAKKDARGEEDEATA